MNTQQATLVIRKLAAYQPNQQFDQYTIDAWASELTRLDYLDALDAVGALAIAPRQPGQPFLIELRDIFAEVGRMRAKRLAERRHLLPEPPSGLTPIEYQTWLAEVTTAAEDRDWTPAVVPMLEQRDVPALLGTIGTGAEA